MSRMRPSLLLVLLLGAAPPQAGPEDGVVIDEVRKEQIDRVARCQETRDWKGYWGHVKGLTARYGHQFVPAGTDRWTSVRQHLLERSAGLPKEAIERYRFEVDPAAIDAFSKARESGRRSAVEAAAEDYFFSSGADEAIDALAREALDEGRGADAGALWEKLLRWYPDPDVPPAVLAARAAHAWATVSNRAGLESVRALVASRRLSGPLRIAGREVELSDFLAGLSIEAPAVLPPIPKLPGVPVSSDADPRPPALSNEIRRWTYDFSADRGEKAEAPPPTPPPQVFIRGRRFLPGQNPGGAPPLAEFPLFPAYARVGGRELVAFTDGFRLVAVDPMRVQNGSLSAGVYFKHPPSGPVPRAPQAAGGYNRPYVGVAIDGDRIFATMASAPLLRPRDVFLQQNDYFEGVTSVKCLRFPSGQVVWDTDSPALLEEFRRMLAQPNSGLGFYDRNFSFCGPPLVSGGRVFLGVCTSPMAEQESAVLCLDRETGRPLWAAAIASFAPGRGGNGFPAGRAAVYQTLLALDAGVLVAQTNLGVLAGLDPVSGRTLWLTRYRRARMRDGGQGDPSFLRPANWPVPWQGDVYVLPQDRPELLAFESATGLARPLPPLRVTDQDVDTRSLTHLLGVANGMLVITGSLSHVVQLSDFKAFTLSVSDAQRAGRGAVVGDRVYLPVSSTSSTSAKPEAAGVSRGVLGIYDQRTWKSVGQPSWRGENEYGNLLAAGRALVVATNRISIYTDAASLRREYESRIAQSPPRVEALLEYGDAMRDNDRLEDAAEAYLDFIRAAEGDPRWEARARLVKGELHAIFLRRGDEAVDPRRALDFYGLAKGFAYDESTRAEATRKLAETFERAGRPREAVAQYQELIERGRGLYHREAGGVRKLWQHARERVEKIVAEAPDAYEEVERRAAEALEDARRRGGEALRDVMDRFPNSKTAVDAWRALRDRLREENSLEKLRGLFRDFEDRFHRGLDFDDRRALLEVLEKTGDADRLRTELDRFAAAFGDREMGGPEKPETARAWAERKRAALNGPARSGKPFPAGPPRALADFEPRTPSADATHAAGGLSPISPMGREPAGLPPGADLFARGSAVELWDVPARRRLWSCARPGAWLGATIAEGADGVASVEGVAAGSPAEKAGLAADDVVLAIDGRGVGAEDFPERIAELAPGRTAELLVRRDGKDLRLRAELAALPADLRPDVVGAAWTCDGSLAVAWEDGVASIDPSTGRVQWTSADVRAGCAIRAFHALDGRLIAYEVPAGPPPAQGAVDPPRAHRLLALSDVTGELCWAHAFPTDPAQAGEPSVTLMGRYFGEHVALLQVLPRGNGKEWYLWTFRADTGEKPDKRMLTGQVAAWTVDEDAGVLYYVSESGAGGRPGERALQSRTLEPSRPGFKQLDLALRPGEHVPPGHANTIAFSLAAEGEYLALLATSAAEHRIRVFKGGAPFRSLSLREGRRLQPGKVEGAFLERGVLHVLNAARDAEGVGFLTAFRIDAPEPSGLIAWDAVAPSLPSGAGSWTLVSGGESCLALVVPGASLEGAEGGGAAFVYDRAAGGRLRLARAADGVVFSRGRMYVCGREKTEVFGE
jgi:outer membrane protein assembly factor BamB/tetratricopeptide (TPR) repeat protein